MDVVFKKEDGTVCKQFTMSDAKNQKQVRDYMDREIKEYKLEFVPGVYVGQVTDLRNITQNMISTLTIVLRNI